MTVDQRATRIARIDCRISLDEVLESIDPQVRPPQRGDDSHGHRLANAEGVADRQSHVTNGDIVHSSEGNRGQQQFLAFRLGDLQDGEI